MEGESHGILLAFLTEAFLTLATLTVAFLTVAFPTSLRQHSLRQHSLRQHSLRLYGSIPSVAFLTVAFITVEFLTVSTLTVVFLYRKGQEYPICHIPLLGQEYPSNGRRAWYIIRIPYRSNYYSSIPYGNFPKRSNRYGNIFHMSSFKLKLYLYLSNMRHIVLTRYELQSDKLLIWN